MTHNGTTNMPGTRTRCNGTANRPHNTRGRHTHSVHHAAAIAECHLLCTAAARGDVPTALLVTYGGKKTATLPCRNEEPKKT